MTPVRILIADDHDVVRQGVRAMPGMTTKTAETHRTQIMIKLNLHSMSELVRYAIRNRIIEP